MKQDSTAFRPVYPKVKGSNDRTVVIMLCVIAAVIGLLALTACAGYLGEKGVRAAVGADANVMADKFDAAENAGEIAPVIGQEEGGSGSPLGWLGLGAAGVLGIWFGRSKIVGWVKALFAAFDSLPFKDWFGRDVPEEEIASTPLRVAELEERLARLERPTTTTASARATASTAADKPAA